MDASWNENQVRTKSSHSWTLRIPGSWLLQMGKSRWIDASELHLVSPTGSGQRGAIKDVVKSKTQLCTQIYTSFKTSLDFTPLRVRSRLVFSCSKGPRLRSILSTRGFLRPLDGSETGRASVMWFGSAGAARGRMCQYPATNHNYELEVRRAAKLFVGSGVRESSGVVRGRAES